MGEVHTQEESEHYVPLSAPASEQPLRTGWLQLMADDDMNERAYEPEEKVQVDDDEEEETSRRGPDGRIQAPPFSWRKLWAFTGPGLLMSIAYLDPGNIESDLQAGAQGGYAMLWILMWATLMGLVIQLLSARVGVASGKHLAELCRAEYPRPVAFCLWILAEIAICGSDIQEVIGSAIAVRILTNGFIPLWGGVLITAVDGFLFLFLETFGVRKLEALFGGFIAIMVIAFARMFFFTQPDFGSIGRGLVIPYVPPSAVSVAVGIVGAVIMPHNVFLHSALVQSRAVNPNKEGKVREAIRYNNIESTVSLFVAFLINLMVVAVFAKLFFGKDIAEAIGLANAGDYLQEAFGSTTFPVLYIWAIGLLAAGQSSTMTGTYAGQFVMAGFLNLRVKKWVRVLITRCFAIVPTVVVALAFDQSNNQLDVLNEWLNVLQSVQLPFATLPLLYMVSNPKVMGAFTVGRWTKLVASLISTLVVGINLFLLFEVAVDLLPHTHLTWIILAAVSAAYVTSIIYLALGPSNIKALGEAYGQRFESRRQGQEGRTGEGSEGQAPLLQ